MSSSSAGMQHATQSMHPTHPISKTGDFVAATRSKRKPRLTCRASRRIRGEQENLCGNQRPIKIAFGALLASIAVSLRDDRQAALMWAMSTDKNLLTVQICFILMSKLRCMTEIAASSTTLRLWVMAIDIGASDLPTATGVLGFRLRGWAMDSRALLSSLQHALRGIRCVDGVVN